MNTNNFIKIINEEIEKFDFLGNDNFLKEQETNDLLGNEDLQKQFICDSLLNRNDKVKILKIVESSINGNWDESNFEDATRLSLDYAVDMAYRYDTQKEPLRFNIYFQGEDINISVGGWYNRGRFGDTPDTDIEPSGESWYDGFDWGDINVSLYTMDGDDIPFLAFEKAPPKIQTLFIRQYVQNFIESQTLDIKTPEMMDNIQNTPYC